MKNFLADDQLTSDELILLLDLAKNIKQSPQEYQQALKGKSVAMVFEKPSLRTHVSFDMGIAKLGGHALYLGQQNGKLGERERVLITRKIYLVMLMQLSLVSLNTQQSNS